MLPTSELGKGPTCLRLEWVLCASRVISGRLREYGRLGSSASGNRVGIPDEIMCLSEVPLFGPLPVAVVEVIQEPACLSPVGRYACVFHN